MDKKEQSIEDVTKNYVKEEVKNEDNEINDIVFDLEEDKDLLKEELKGGAFFSLEEGITYKIKLTTTKVRRLEKVFPKEDGEDDKVIKYELGIEAKGSDKSEFLGVWEVGRAVLDTIFKGYEKDAVFNVSRTGKGMKTRYSVSKDF